MAPSTRQTTKFQKRMEDILNYEQEGFAAEESASDDFFPFPNEKFFCCICYAHSVMRPKVKRCEFFINLGVNMF